jgi:Domain of unknown function (DUF4173)
MNDKTKTGLQILEVSIVLGILADSLLRETPFGLNILLWISALVLAMIFLGFRNKSETLNLQTVALHGALIFFAACFAWRDSGQLKLLDGFAILTILAVLTLPMMKIATHLAGVSQYGFAFVLTTVNAAFSPFLLLIEDITWKTFPQTGLTKHIISVFRGLTIAAPILLIFGGLFMAADAVFEGIVQNTFNFDPKVLVTHSITIAAFSWVVAGYLRGSLTAGFAKLPDVEVAKNENRSQPLSVTQHTTDEPIAKDETQTETPKADETSKQTPWNWQKMDNSMIPGFMTLGMIEITIVLGLINLLFFAFVIVQTPYLFGGFELVQQTADLKLANYARRGFGELVTVAALVLPILLTSHWLLRRNQPKNELLFRILAGIQIGLLFVIMLSAAQRLFILTGNLGYGLTIVRLYPMVFMIWLAVVFVLFGVTVLRNRRQHFAWGALWSAMLILGVMHFFNPDDYIARTNIRLMQEGRGFDAAYHQTLSADAAPALLNAIPLMDNFGKCEMKYKIETILQQGETDFRSWNYSRTVEHELANDAATQGLSINCPKRTDWSENEDFSREGISIPQ